MGFLLILSLILLPGREKKVEVAIKSMMKIQSR